MSIITSEGSLTKMLTEPLVPTGMIASFAVGLPSDAFSVDTVGCGRPVGQAVRKPRAPVGTAVIVNEYACAVAGMLHEPDRIGKSRLTPRPSEGAPNAPPFPLPARVSTTRQGFIGTKPSPVVLDATNIAVTL